MRRPLAGVLLARHGKRMSNHWTSGFVAECGIYQTRDTKVRRQTPYRLLHPVLVPHRRWNVDFVSGLSDLNIDRVNNVLTVTCKYSRAVI